MSIQVASLDDIKSSSSQSESSNAAKTIALDHLGVVAARIRSSMLKVRQHHRSSAEQEGGREKGKTSLLKPLDEVWPVFPNTLDILRLPVHIDRLQR